MIGSGILPAWLVLPVAGVLMLLVAWHAVALELSAEPASRKRIRVVNGWVMLIGIPVVASGFSLVDPEGRPRAFVMIWAVGIGLLLISVTLAAVDMVNTWRLAKSDREELQRGLREALRDRKGGKG